MLYTSRRASYERRMEPGSSEGRANESEVIPSATATLHELLGISSHDISNPLQTIGVLLEILTDIVEPTHPAHQRVTQAAEASERMRMLVKGLGDFVRSAPGDDRPREPRIIAHSVHQVLARRCARQRLSWTIGSTQDLARSAEIRGPLHIVLLDFLLGALAATSHDTEIHYEIINSTEVQDQQIAWRFTLFENREESRQELPISAQHHKRIEMASHCDFDFRVELRDLSTMIVWLSTEEAP